MLYIVFNTQEQLNQANVRYMQARADAGIHDTKQGIELEPEVTSRWSNGREMLDGRLACPVPDKWVTEFKGEDGIELELTDEDFPVIEEVI